jgi:DNA mismatch repair protein MutS2
VCGTNIHHPPPQTPRAQFLDGKPTYRFREGAIGESYALEVAERLELPVTVLERARALMDDGVVKVTELVKELEAQRDALEVEIAAARQREEVRRWCVICV